jgi:glutaconyl-CoA/methylmalonyl-CoA decarboxylase subunit gamma
MRQFRVLVNGNEYKVAIEELAGEGAISAPQPTPQKAAPAAPAAPKPAAPKAAPPKAEGNGSASGTIAAAMPGTILDVKVNVGDSVTRGQTLLILEAMKMENEIMAPCDGVVEEVHTTKGASVNSGDLLMVLV